MESEEMLMDMYKEAITAADLRAICKTRGFTAEEVSSPGVFKTVFRSDKGIKSAFVSLTRNEIALLHVLDLINKAVDVSFFEYLYRDPESDSKAWHYQSFTTRYRDIFKKVRTSLVRKGVLLFAESRNRRGTTTKLERWQFRFPEEFNQLLPSPFVSVKIFDAHENVCEDILRRKIKQVVTGKPVHGEAPGYDITLSAGKLSMGGGNFRMQTLKKWQVQSWTALALREKEKNYKKEVVSPIQVVSYAFSQLNQNEWILPEEFSRFWRVLYPEGCTLDSSVICEAGCKWGYLRKHEYQGKSYYHPVEALDATRVKPDSYQTVKGDQTVEIDLETIPYENLEVLAEISKMTVVDSRLLISPDLIAIGNADPNIRNHPQTLWLRHNSSLFRAVLEKVDENWGKIIIHENLMVARVRDIGLLVKLQQSCPDHKQIIPLAKDFIAFPQDALPELQKLVARSGYVVKTVQDVKNNGEREEQS
ncbi:MAG: hypothetical protein WAV32_01270 [Halobacteriota archaeon]